MPFPIVPAPITPTRCIAIMTSLVIAYEEKETGKSSRAGFAQMAVTKLY
jgi:hypothetical protein